MKPKRIEEYICSAPAEVQESLWQLHETIETAAPGASEALKWGMPAYSYQKILVSFAACKKHIGFYPMESAVKAFTKDLTKYETTGRVNPVSAGQATAFGLSQEDRNVQGQGK